MTDLRKLPHGNVVRRIPVNSEAMAAAKAPGIDKLKANIAQYQREAESYKQKDPKRYQYLMNDVDWLMDVLKAAQRGDREGVQSVASHLDTAVRDEIPLDMWRWSMGRKDKPLGFPAPGYQQAVRQLALIEQELKQAEAEKDKEHARHLKNDVLPGLREVVAAAAKGDYIKAIQATQNDHVRRSVVRELMDWINEQKRLRLGADASNAVSMARVAVPAGTKVTTDKGDSGTLAQAWDGTSLRVIINSDKRGRIEVHPSNVYVNGRSLRDIAAGQA